MRKTIVPMIVLALGLSACRAGNTRGIYPVWLDITPTPNYEATTASWGAWCESCGGTLSVLEDALTAVAQETIEPCPNGCYCLWGADGFLGRLTCPDNFTATPEPAPATALPVVTLPEYLAFECGGRPPNGTLARVLKPMASRTCPDYRCHKQGHALIGSIRPIEWLAQDEETGEYWLGFTYLPLEEKPYNLLNWEKKDGDWQWVLEQQFVAGVPGFDFECVEKTQ